MITKEQYRDPHLLHNAGVSPEAIAAVGFYPGEFYALSNFAAFRLDDWLGRSWPTSEHAYHGARFFEADDELFEEVWTAASAHEAFKVVRRGKNIERQRPSWDAEKVATMEQICRLKLGQHAYVRSSLIRTGNLDIIEDSPKDAFWGWGENRQGRNELGKIWMNLREELRRGEIEQL